jgi:hypothetical protein
LRGEVGERWEEKRMGGKDEDGRKGTNGQSGEGDDEEHDCCSMPDIGDRTERCGCSCDRREGNKHLLAAGQSQRRNGKATRTKRAKGEDEPGIIDTYAPLAHPKRMQKAMRPPFDLQAGMKMKMRMPERKQFGVRMVKGP